MERALKPSAEGDCTRATCYTAAMNGPALDLLDPKPPMEFGLSNRSEKKTQQE